MSLCIEFGQPPSVLGELISSTELNELMAIKQLEYEELKGPDRTQEAFKQMWDKGCQSES